MLVLLILMWIHWLFASLVPRNVDIYIALPVFTEFICGGVILVLFCIEPSCMCWYSIELLCAELLLRDTVSVCLCVCVCVYVCLCMCVCVTVLHRIIAGRPRACAMSDYIRPRHHGIYCRLLYTLPGLDENYILISVVSDVCIAWYDTVLSALWRRHHTTCYTLQCRLITLHTHSLGVSRHSSATFQLIILACVVAYVQLKSNRI